VNKEIVIYGAGKIGRGFIADIFHTAGYQLIFADCNKELIHALNAQGKYNLYNIASAEEREKKIITGFIAIDSDDVQLRNVVQKAGLMAVVVFQDAFGDIAKLIVSILQKKYSEHDEKPLDIIVLANIVGPQKLLKKAIDDLLDDELKAYANRVLGVLGTVVQRVAVQPTKEMQVEDSLTVLTDGYGILPLEADFKGARPQSTQLEYHENLDLLELRKLYTYNMAHAATAYYGFCKGYNFISDALNDPEIEALVYGALEEICTAFTREYGNLSGFSETEMKAIAKSVIKKFKNPMLNDTPVRVGANPIRKLGFNDRLIGAALMARSNGIYPYYLLKAAAYGFMYDQESDEAAAKIQQIIKCNGIEGAIREVTKLNEKDIIYHIETFYKKAAGKFVMEDLKRVRYIKDAYETGFQSEKKYRGCAQGTLMAMFQITGIKNDDVFKAASGFSGGMALCGDGVCGGYSGGVMFMSLLRGRSLNAMQENGDKINQYMSYETAQLLHDRYLDCYGSSICKNIHEGMFNGEHFILRTKPRRNEFEDAGAHTYVCTSVVGLACAWIVDILLEKKIITLEKGEI